MIISREIENPFTKFNTHCGEKEKKKKNLSETRNKKELPRYEKQHLKKKIFREFTGGPVVRIPCFHCQGYRFNPSLAPVLRSRKLCSIEKKKKT